MENEDLQKWLDNHYITYRIRHDVLVIPGWGKALIQSDYDHIFEKSKDGTEVSFFCTENIDLLLGDNIFYVVFPFGDRWYYVDIREPLTSVQFKVLRYVGNLPVFNHACGYCPLGIHTGYELLNGSGLLKDWCSKVKFLGYSGIGVVDRNTFASSIDLQNNATAAKLPYVFGYSTNVVVGDESVGVIIYCHTDKGFQNMLRIQKLIGVDSEDGTIGMIDLLNHAEGNVLVFDKLSGHWLCENRDKLDDFVNAFDGWVYFQVDLTEYKADRIDSVVLDSIKSYFDTFYRNGDCLFDIRPILIQDVYYLDKEDWKNKILLNKIDIGAAHNQSTGQFLKTIDELYDDYAAVFDLDKYGDDLFYDMCDATLDILENAAAQYDLTENYAPQYEMTPEEKKKYGSNLNMFRSLIESGFKRLVPDGMEEVYRERVEYEKNIIESTNNVDYFLIQYDTINWAAENGILVGLGRGSAGGSLLLYLMGITQIDPIRYGLIFERFLLPERAGLEPSKATKLLGKIESTDYVEVSFDDGRTFRFDNDAVLRVDRSGVEMDVYADELQEDDEIIFDNHALLWELQDY